MTAEEIKSIRQALGLTQEEMAVKIGVIGITVSRWERGMRPKGAALKNLRHLQKQAQRRGLLPVTDSPKTKNPGTSDEDGQGAGHAET